MIKPKNPLISIIIPCLNEEKYIESTLKTIKNQKLHNFEIIIIDGLSKDNTVKIAREYADRVIVEKNVEQALLEMLEQKLQKEKYCYL